MDTDLNRRRLLRHAAGSALGFPVIWLAQPACAARNAAARASLKYQDSPFEGQSCTSCLEWVPGPTPTDKGACKQIPGDDEIAPDGWCTAWNSL